MLWYWISTILSKKHIICKNKDCNYHMSQWDIAYYKYHTKFKENDKCSICLELFDENGGKKKLSINDKCYVYIEYKDNEYGKGGQFGPGFTIKNIYGTNAGVYGDFDQSGNNEYRHVRREYI